MKLFDVRSSWKGYLVRVWSRSMQGLLSFQLHVKSHIASRRSILWKGFVVSSSSFLRGYSNTSALNDCKVNHTESKQLSLSVWIFPEEMNLFLICTVGLTKRNCASFNSDVSEQLLPPSTTLQHRLNNFKYWAYQRVQVCAVGSIIYTPVQIAACRSDRDFTREISDVRFKIMKFTDIQDNLCWNQPKNLKGHSEFWMPLNGEQMNMFNARSIYSNIFSTIDFYS